MPRPALFAAMALLTLLAACGPTGETPDGGSPATDGGTADAGPDDGGPTDGGLPDGDEAILDAIRAGELDPAAGLLEVARGGGGWPIATGGGFLFARRDDGRGPYHLSGDHTGWAPVEMQREGGVWWVRSEVPTPEGAMYKFVDGSGAFAADPLARRYGHDENGEFSLVRSSGGHLERWPDLGGDGLLPRTLRVWVPTGTPVRHLYVHDGQNLFDPAAPFGSWRLHEVLGEATLAVGLDNTADRMDEYTHVQDRIGGSLVGGRADAYADFVMDVVRPLIEAEYGVPTRRGVMGSSLGGLVSLHQALRHPGAWDFAAGLSSTFGWGRISEANETLIERYADAGHGTTPLYVDSGGGPGEGCVDTDGDGLQDDAADASDNYCETRQMADTLAGVGYTWEVDLWHWHEPGAEHTESAWAARVHRPVALFEGL